MNNDIMLKVENVYKKYRLGTIGGGTLSADLQSWWAKIRHKEDPNSIIGSNSYKRNEEFYALNGISFEVKKGEAIGIIGGNGAGKSTTLKLISQVTAPTKGKIHLNGRIASMLEVGTGFHPELTGRENIYMNGAILGMTKSEIDAKIEDIIDFSECRQFIDTPVKRYSSGMYVKLAFSVAAHLDSEILIMDEVLAVGDMKFQQKCIKKMLSVVNDEGRTILYVSHNMNTIRQLCSRCIVLSKGKVIFDGDNETAIQKYMENNVTLENQINLDVLKRGEWLGNDLCCKMKKVVVNNNNCIINDGEPLSFELEWFNNTNLDKLCLRAEFRCLGESVATSFLQDFIACKENTTDKYIFNINVDNLLPRTYQVALILFQYSEDGSSFDCDGVLAFAFEKISNDNLKNNWNYHSWGSFETSKIYIDGKTNS